LKNEYHRGEQELVRIAALKDECLGRAWSRVEHVDRQLTLSTFTNARQCHDRKTRSNSGESTESTILSRRRRKNEQDHCVVQHKE
jgi:hypothetical protein